MKTHFLSLTLLLFAVATSYGQNNTFPTSGNVGIGTSQPQCKLHTVSSNNTSNASSYLWGQYYGTQIGIQSSSSAYYAFGVSSGMDQNGSGGTTRFIVKGDGNVGIGTTVPQMQFEVAGSNAYGSGQILRNTSSTGYTTLRLYNNLNQNTRALEIDYSGSGYTGALVAGSPVGESAAIVTTGAFPLSLGTNNTGRMVITSAGNVGIGTTTPGHKLDVNGAVNATSFLVNGQPISGSPGQWTTLNSDIYFNTGNIGVGTTTPEVKLAVHGDIRWGSNSLLKSDQGSSIEMRGTGTPYVDLSNDASSDYDVRMVLMSDDHMVIEGGNVSIGTFANPGYKLAVGGKIISEEVVVKLQSNWPDYVFEKDYKLPSLEELQLFIAEHKHLPGVPSAKEVQENGVAVGEMNAILLKKIEELTLHLIKQQAEIDALKKKTN